MGARTSSGTGRNTRTDLEVISYYATKSIKHIALSVLSCYGANHFFQWTNDINYKRYQHFSNLYLFIE